MHGGFICRCVSTSETADYSSGLFINFTPVCPICTAPPFFVATGMFFCTLVRDETWTCKVDPQFYQGLAEKFY